MKIYKTEETHKATTHALFLTEGKQKTARRDKRYGGNKKQLCEELQGSLSCVIYNEVGGALNDGVFAETILQ